MGYTVTESVILWVHPFSLTVNLTRYVPAELKTMLEGFIWFELDGVAANPNSQFMVPLPKYVPPPLKLKLLLFMHSPGGAVNNGASKG